MLVDTGENVAHDQEGIPSSVSASRADAFPRRHSALCRAVGYLAHWVCVQWGRFPPHGELFFLYSVVSGMFILETNTLVTKKKKKISEFYFFPLREFKFLCAMKKHP